MKTNTVFLSLVAGAVMCFSSATYAQHHGGGDNAFGEGTNVVTVGVGFGGGLGAYTLPGYSTSSGVGFNLSYERGLSSHWGIGLTMSYASSSMSYTNSPIADSIGPNGLVQYGSVTDKYTLSIIGFTARGYYHFATSAKFDPYVGIGLGYGSVSSKFTETFTPSTIQGATYVVPGISIAAAMGGVFLGARYYFSDHVGLWAELQWEGYLANIANVGVAFKF